MHRYKDVGMLAVENIRLRPVSGTVFGKWQNWNASQILHHGGACCETARTWLFAMDFSELGGASRLTGPRWLRKRFEWGPTRWHIHWCEAVRQTTLDCGAQAALATAIFQRRGVICHPVQLVQRFSREATLHWTQKWTSMATPVDWINDDLIYHEGCAVVVNKNEIKIWDASAGWWIAPEQGDGYGSLLALRIVAPPDARRPFDWGRHRIEPNHWRRLRKKTTSPPVVQSQRK